VCSAASIADLSVSKIDSDINDFAMLKTAKYVGIDDLGVEPVNVKNWGTDTSPVIDIIYHRYNEMKLTVLSTNLNMDMIQKTYGQRIYDRFCEMYDIINFNFQSFRQTR
jgi:DNA replication protein DnaC